ncbi:hypothetical protein BpHYR1_032050 [Brachionus plicatilis]|uniref:Uncharacterized protein n=1 Tax=Brachionus plicatilis TaxID=10195 RepID=A0A3M7S0S5_BRAPC|nr:hypothetical protein BpHYR1_032050 [Brachionus plicatilis]
MKNTCQYFLKMARFLFHKYIFYLRFIKYFLKFILFNEKLIMKIIVMNEYIKSKKCIHETKILPDLIIICFLYRAKAPSE